MPSDISLAVVDGEPRVDSRLVAAGLGVDHKATMQLVDKYSAQFQEFGQRRSSADGQSAALIGRLERGVSLNPNYEERN